MLLAFENFRFHRRPMFHFQFMRIIIAKDNDVLDTTNVRAYSISQRCGHTPRMTRFALERMIIYYPEHPVGLCFETVEAVMVLHDQENHQRCADTDGKSQDIDQGEDPVAPEVPQRDEQVVFEHGKCVGSLTGTKGYASWRRYCESTICKSDRFVLLSGIGLSCADVIQDKLLTAQVLQADPCASP